MSDIFITSDEHYGHANIIKFCNRPFADTREMQEELIRRHNAKVPDNPNITTIHLGDMFWRTVTVDDAVSILKRLHGGHAFIYGNHDELIANDDTVFGSRKLVNCFRWTAGRNKESAIRILHWNKHAITLCHYAMLTWNRSSKGDWHLFGHSHGELKHPGMAFDIGVDCHNYEPWSLEEIEAEMNRRSNAGKVSSDNGRSGDVALTDV